MNEELKTAVAQSVTLLWGKRNKPQDEAMAVKQLYATCQRNRVTPGELREAVGRSLDSSPFYPDPSELLRLVRERRLGRPTVGVLLPTGRVRHVEPGTEEQVYRDEWGVEPAWGVLLPPDGVKGQKELMARTYVETFGANVLEQSGAKALPEIVEEGE